jgi:NAD(P)-dependent dehydrogenase (short-subunit alcohol dehydrogenase family)
MDIRGKVALVTGAAAGIGRATAIRLAELGAKGIVVADIDRTGIGTTAGRVTELGADVVESCTDVTVTSALETMYAAAHDRFGQIDIVFNNAGIVSGPPPFPDTAPERIKLVIDIDLLSVIQSSVLAIRYMRAHGGGVIVNTASTGGLNPYLADAPYAAAKAGVIMFSRSCKDLHQSAGIRVNAVCPGVTDTPILEKTGGGRRPDWLAPILEKIEILGAEDIAQAVVRIIEDDGMAGEYVVVQNKPKT